MPLPPVSEISPSTCDEKVAARIVLRGSVQGHGVRPAIARLATELRIAGHVANSGDGVEVVVEGTAVRLAAFHDRLAATLPCGASVAGLSSFAIAVEHRRDFVIRPSTTGGAMAVRVPVDVAVCAKCLDDTASAENRRAGFPFTTCTQCGPRYSLIDSMPYDRASTGMASFVMCSDCQGEYADPRDRRFHSQTNSCPKCGPRIWLTTSVGAVVVRDRASIVAAANALRDGKILALRGVGGYQLLVDATSTQAVATLRRRKHRLGKPLAVMVADLREADGMAVLDDADCRLLTSRSNPIVIAPLRRQASVAPEVGKGLSTIGLMLPTSPLHARLLHETGRPLVVTSGNIEGEPLRYQALAESEPAAIADLCLDHNRPIARPIDDSVVRVVAGRPTAIRLARGLAPLPLNVSADRVVLALGGQQKAAIALSSGVQAVLGPHLGDLSESAVRDRYLEHIDALRKLYGVPTEASPPELIVHDLHPDYFTSVLAAGQLAPRLAVQHHHAHVAAAMVEHGWLDRTVLGVAWDGSGYGPDGAIWGGEFLRASATGYERVACLRPMRLPGGESAVREPWRVAVSLVHQSLGRDAAAQLRFDAVSARQVEQTVAILERPWLSPTTTSAGRLFDGVAALVLGISHAQFEGQAAMLLEDQGDGSPAVAYSMPLVDGKLPELDWRPLVAEVLDDYRAGRSPCAIAMRFHHTLAEGVAAVCRRRAELPVVVAGGCFQNRILTELVAAKLDGSRQPIGLPGIIPVGDGGLAAGQLAIGLARLRQLEPSSTGAT